MGAQTLNPIKFERFGKYILLERIATGGMAEVWLARTQSERGITKFVAIKKILPEFSKNKEFVNMFLSEAAIVVNLLHPNIVTVYEFGEERGQLYLVMDYVEGRSLLQIQNRLAKSGSKIPLAFALYIAREVAAGLSSAHSATDKSTGLPLNVVHRDVSPHNILVSYEGDVRLIDFGVAKAAKSFDDTETGSIKGKLAYLSPEQVDGKKATAKSDIFSLGICMWELVAGSRLFQGKTEFEYLSKIHECQIPLPSSVNPNVGLEFERIILRALSEDPNQRFSSASELHKEISILLNRLYPEFNKNDFSIFAKKLYSDLITKRKDALIEFASDPKKSTVTVYGTPSGPINKYVEREPRKFPFKLVFLFAILLKTFFLYNVEYQKVVLAALPDKAKPLFLKFIDPFIDVSDETPSLPLSKDEIVKSQATTKDAKAKTESPTEYVNINGSYYEYRPDGIYLINGHKIFFRVKRKE